MLRRSPDGEHPLLVLGQEGEHRLAEGAGVDRDDDADLGHLPAAVGARLVVDDHDVVDEQHAGAHGEPGAPGEVLGPRDGPATAARGCRGRRCRAAARPGRAGSGWSRAPARPCRARPGCGRCRASSTGASSRRAASSDRLIRRAPWSAVRTRIARSTDWITASASFRRVTDFTKTLAHLVNHRCNVQTSFDIIESYSDTIKRRGTAHA